ncbi:hypothetical protein U8P71_36200 (plasmid) [Rhizobium ruizarguesonis]|nr:hypothetical protein U8P71_36200 [Rhizobium ruizarguesonis]
MATTANKKAVQHNRPDHSPKPICFPPKPGDNNSFSLRRHLRITTVDCPRMKRFPKVQYRAKAAFAKVQRAGAEMLPASQPCRRQLQQDLHFQSSLVESTHAIAAFAASGSVIQERQRRDLK